MSSDDESIDLIKLIRESNELYERYRVKGQLFLDQKLQLYEVFIYLG